MSFIILGDSFTFPDGDAATNRVYTYAKGFNENGINVHVICFRNEYLQFPNGISDGISYYHPYGQSKRNKYFLIRRWLNFRKYLKTFFLLKEINRQDKIIAITLYSQQLWTILVASVFARILNTKIFLERSEHPLRNFETRGMGHLQGNFKLALEIRLFDGIFCISNYLIDFYRNRGYSQQKLFLVPSTVDTARFNCNSYSPLPYQYIMYCGSLTILKDGVNILIESFAKIAEKYPEIKLVLIGKADSSQEQMIFNRLVTTLNVKTRVVFTGKLSRIDIPAYICNAKILALARPHSLIADAGFPSKLSEYLATGIPIVVTSVGEIPVYLKDSENAFLAEPGNIDAFADKLDYVLGNYKIAQQVGEKGKELTATVFDYNFQAKRMIDFINKSNQ